MRVGLIGYGEVGRIFAAGLRGRPGVAALAAWDIAFADPVRRDEAQAHAAAAGVAVCDGAAVLCAASDLVISAVTAAQTLAVAQEAAAALPAGRWFLDLNSASPATKRRAAEAFEAAGGRYVEAGVMTSVPPLGIAVPMLLGGPHAATLHPVLAGWGLQTQVISDRWGVASAVKMCRSVMIKGLEALVIEAYTAARAHGVEDAMLATLAETFPGIDWPRQGAYFFSRVARHGRRRAEEMREAAATVREAGLQPLMAQAIADRQQAVADRAAAGAFAAMPDGARWQDWADRLLAPRPPSAADQSGPGVDIARS